MRRRLAPLVAAAVTVAACTSGGSDARHVPSSKPITTSTSVSAPTDGALEEFEVASLGLSFSLPTTFTQVHDPEFGFLARSQNPRAVFSIDPESPDVIKHVAEAGENVSNLRIGGLDAVLIQHAAVDGLPPGIEAKELLVANGGRSFSVILSTERAALSGFWDAFVGSVVLTGS